MHAALMLMWIEFKGDHLGDIDFGGLRADAAAVVRHGDVAIGWVPRGGNGG